MNADMFKKWLSEKLLPNLEEPSVMVMDNASYHSTQSEKQPTTSWTKPELIDWLTENKIPHDKRSLKKDLYALCESYKKPISHEITAMIQKSGHEVLKTPPYCYFYNPIELVWGQCKRYYDAHVAPECDYTKAKAMEVWEEALSQVTPERWNRYVNHTERKVFEDYKRFIDEKFAVEIEDNPGLAIHSDSDYNDDDDDDDLVTVSDRSESYMDVSSDRSHLDGTRKNLLNDIDKYQAVESDDEDIKNLNAFIEIPNDSVRDMQNENVSTSQDQNQDQIPMIFDELPNDLSLQEEVIACYEELVDMIEDIPEGETDNPLNQFNQSHVDAAVK
ncbi:uncharacterized protein LOC141532260 [Cotesia typhae]|uniref:uncharacterized protein LOC141532260 n=1 Tax=Cotesia typhae TaxID=2053667 RepID=UPI003D6816E5